jgi:hypothetical protein
MRKLKANEQAQSAAQIAATETITSASAPLKKSVKLIRK